MCILIAMRRDRGGPELWLGANRDEKLDRPWEPPRLLIPAPAVFGGRDLVGGGSWLAANRDAGFVVGVANAGRGARPGLRSRGQMVVKLAAESSLAEAVARFSALQPRDYGAFNLMLVDAARCWLATNTPATRLEMIAEPVAAIGNDPLDAPGERVVAAAARVGELVDHDDAALIAGMQVLLADHSGDDPICRHGRTYGTVCSTILTLRGARLMTYLFAPGPPCTAPFAPVALPPRSLPR